MSDTDNNSASKIKAARGISEDKNGQAAKMSSQALHALPGCSLQAAALVQAIHSADVCVFCQTPDFIYQMAENIPALLQEKWHKGCTEEELFSPVVAAQMRRAKQQVQASGQSARLEVKLAGKVANSEDIDAKIKDEAELLSESSPQTAEQGLKAEAEAARRAMAEEMTQFSDNSVESNTYFSTGKIKSSQTLWLQFSIEAQHDDQGRFIGFVTTGVNISKLRAREEVLKVLLREVSHRSKNLLAVIQSIAVQTARFSHSTSSFLKKLQGRLQSLSSSQDLVTDSDWRGAYLHDLIFAQTQFYTEQRYESGETENHKSREQNICKVEVVGKNPYLFPSAALHIGLALHELVINSVSFGALGLGKGGVTISCEKINSKTEILHETEPKITGLQICWREHFPISPPASNAAPIERKEEDGAESCRAHFGSTVLERIVPASVNGTAKYSIKNGYIEYILNISQDNYKDKNL